MKKLIALLFVVAMLCTAMVMPAMAANEAPAITVSSAAAGEGQTATLNIAVENNPGIFSFTMELMYDDTSLELIAVNSDINVLANLENGKVNYTDYVNVLSQSKYPNETILTGYARQCADITGEGSITFTDFLAILSHAKGITSLW